MPTHEKAIVYRNIRDRGSTAKERFSRTAIIKASGEFKKMQAARGEWVSSGDVDKVIKQTPYNPSKMLIFSSNYSLNDNYVKYFSDKLFKRDSCLINYE